MKSVENNLYRIFERHFPESREAVLIDAGGGERYTYDDAETQSALLAQYFTSLGLEPGDRITVQVEKSPQFLWLYLACLRAGLVFHPLNTAYQRAELEYFIADAEPAAIICDTKKLPLFTELAAGIRHLFTLDSDGSGSLFQSCRDSVREGQIAHGFSTRALEPDALAALLYSSGTTGRPKGIMLSHRNLAANAEVLVQAWGFTSADRLLHALPVFHVHGLFVAIGCVLASGASLVWLPKFDVAQVLERLPDATVFMGVPTFYTRLLQAPTFSAGLVSAMRLFISGSAPLLAETFNAFKACTGHVILERYGMTETNMNTSNPLRGERKPGTVGMPLPGVEVRVVDENGKVLGDVGAVGNLQVKGKNVFRGYWRMPEKTAEDFTGDGFFNTGDKASIDSDGYVTIVGRSKDMIISGGLNIYPKEIEAVIDKIDGVVESAVIGVEHPDFGEGAVAVVVAQSAEKLAAGDIITRLKSSLAAFKVPKKVVFVDELPRNAMGKVQKNVLRQRYAGLLKLTQ